jgi:predicted nuclease of predicted toxin-antitoxin system
VKFKIDENLPIEVAEILQSANFDTKTVTEQNLSGEKDSVIAQICQKEDRILVTLDLDFADVRILNHEPISNRLWIVEESRVRVRGED